MSENSLSKIALRAMAFRLSIVIFIFASIGFWFNYHQLEKQTVRELDLYIKERVEREAIHFHVAAKNLKLFQAAFINDYMTDERNFEEEFRRKFKQNPNGTWSPAKPDHTIQMFLKKGVKVTPEMKKAIVILNDLLHEFGFAWSSNFTNIWASGEEDYGLTFWPSRPDALSDLSVDHSFLGHEFMTVGLPQNNPQGKARWTGPYRDVMSDDWMISINQPIFIEGKYKLSVGMDILLNDFFSRSVSNVLPGTYNIVVREDGRLITHPNYQDEILKAHGNFYIGNQKIDRLKHLMALVKSADERVIEDEKHDRFLGIGKIKGPGWLFILVYPKANLYKAARETAIFLFLIGIISLLIELLIMYQVIEKHISLPIKKLIQATFKVTEGNQEARVEDTSDNELGKLARSFNVMAEKVRERDFLLSMHAQKLEEEVQERTRELDEQRVRAFQAAKMATLGEISAGIAHEINNPLSTIALSAGGLRRRLEKGTVDAQMLYPYLSRIEDTSHRISKIVKGMRAFSREATTTDEMSSVHLRVLIENALTLCEETLKKNEVSLYCSDVPDVTVKCREVEITQTLLNLIQNAIDAVSGMTSRRIVIKFEQDRDKVKIIIEDSGPGIPEQYVDKVMNPFFTTKDVGKGTGLGLFISCGLVKSNGGTLTLDQSKGATQFVVTLQRG